MPSTIRLSLVSVPVLSKQQISTLPANGILNGSVQNTPKKDTSLVMLITKLKIFGIRKICLKYLTWIELPKKYLQLVIIL